MTMNHSVSGILRNMGKVSLLLSVTFSVLLFAGCSFTSSKSLTSTQPLPTSTPTLAPISAQPGWVIKAQLGVVSNGVVNSGTQFVVQKPFEVVVNCEGEGDLNITVAYATNTGVPVDSQVEHCTNSPQGYTVSELYPHVGATVDVTIASDLNVVWSGVLQTQQ